MLKISVVKILSMRVAECSQIHVGRFMTGMAHIFKMLS